MLQFGLPAANLKRCKQRHMSKLKIPKLSPAEENDLFEPTVVMPMIEEDIPIPKTKQEAIPEMNLEQEVEVRSNTIKTIADINNEDIAPSKEHEEQAKQLAREMTFNNRKKLIWVG